MINVTRTVARLPLGQVYAVAPAPLKIVTEPVVFTEPLNC